MIQEIWHGDCLELMKNIPDGNVDLVVTSPPYDNLRDYNKRLEWNQDIWQNVVKELFRIVSIGGTVVWIVSDATVDGSETGTSFKQALYFKSVGFNIHDTMIWKKQTFTDTGSLRIRYPNVFEYMFVFCKGKPKAFNPIKDRENKGPRKKHGTIRQPDGSTRPQSSLGKVYSDKLSQRFNIWEINTEVSNLKRKHPAQFPENLAKDHILSWSNENDLVLDPFAGSGTTLVMAKELNRQFIGIEKEKEYYDICVERLK